MYDELIGNLRAQATHFHFNDDTSLLLCKAADAIEELETQLRAEKVDNVNLTGWLAEEHAKAEDFENKMNLWRQDKIRRWIPVAEELPEKEDEAVIVWEKQGFALIDWRHDNKWAILDNNCGIATHWMPLPNAPEPPKEET